MDRLKLDKDPAELLDPFQFDGPLLRRGWLIGTFDCGICALRDGAAPPDTHRQVVTDPVEPRAGIVGDAPSRDLRRQSEERVLDQVLGLEGVADDARQIAKQ
jgi:hypothetical protein